MIEVKLIKKYVRIRVISFKTLCHTYLISIVLFLSKALRVMEKLKLYKITITAPLLRTMMSNKQKISRFTWEVLFGITACKDRKEMYWRIILEL